jgi:hypothetical protein
MTNEQRLRLRQNLSEVARGASRRTRRSAIRRSVAPEATLALAALALGALAMAMHSPRDADALLTRVATALMRPDQRHPDLETTGSIGPRPAPSPAADEPLQPDAQLGGERDRPARVRIDIDMGEDSLRGGL